MRHISTKKKTKRGNEYNTRKTKLANGYSKVLADRKSSSNSLNSGKYSELLKLAVKGTLDPLANNGLNNMFGPSRLVQKEHPTDKGYFAQVVVLSDAGRKKLERYRRRL